MGLISDLGHSSPVQLLRENSEHSLQLLQKFTNEQDGMDENKYGDLVPELCQSLSLAKHNPNDPNNSPNIWDWFHTASPDKLKTLQLEIAVSCLEKCTNIDLQLQLAFAISLYSNPEVPWSNSHLSSISLRAANKNSISNASWPAQFAENVFSRFLVVSGHKLTTVPSSRGAKTRFTKTRVARPALGLQIPSATEDTQRAEWKSSENVTVLSSVVFLMACDHKSEYAAKCASFTLNVMDDPDPLFRTQGCFLLQQIVSHGHGDILVRAGLVSVFEESVKTCLAYLPQLTPPEISLRLLKDGAYPALFSILDISKDTTYVSYLEVLNSHILASISHVSGRNSDESTTATTNELLAFLFSRISDVISKKIHLSVLACFSRVNYVLCQTITNPYVIETEQGDAVVEAALKVHGTILRLCNSHEDSSAAVLIFQYRLDFLAAWAILGKRVVKFGVGNPQIKHEIRENTDLLREVSKKAGVDDVEEDLEAVLGKVPELRDLL